MIYKGDGSKPEFYWYRPLILDNPLISVAPDLVL